MKSILSLVCVAFFATFAYANERKLEDAVDMWSMVCKEDSCLMTIEKPTRESFPNHDFFVLGMRVAKVGGKPVSFVFLPASNPEQTRVAFIFYDIQKGEPRLVTRASTAFLTQPCSTPNECKRVFDGAVVPQLPDKGESPELNLWEAMNTHEMLLILQFSAQRVVHRSALISLFPFRKGAEELWQSYLQSANPSVQGTLRDKTPQPP